MPCRDDGNPTEETTPAWMLCEAMTILEKLEFTKTCSSQLLFWWESHKIKEEDRVRVEAASKLSERERLVLGIDAKGQLTRTRVIKARR